ncbi:50S ribosomal protein L18 [Candidatus Saccharibacteria bacterium]|nr:50S ribosomal protein L18 [Candidatus Saccharibacteria bacterium]
MQSTDHKQDMVRRRSRRVRARVVGTAKRPRLSVHISNLHITAQIINDGQGQTLAHVSTVGTKQSGSLSEKAAWVGSQIAAKAKKSKVTKIVLDRGPKRYHGRVKALAEAARQAGLEF